MPNYEIDVFINVFQAHGFEMVTPRPIGYSIVIILCVHDLGEYKIGGPRSIACVVVDH